MKTILEVFEDVCKYEAARVNEFQKEVTVTAKVQKLAKKLIKKDEEKAKFKKLSDDVYEFNDEFRIELDNECSCPYFQKYAKCVHYAAVALLERRSLKGMPIIRVLRVRGKRSKKIEDNDEEEDQDLVARLNALQSSAAVAAEIDPPMSAPRSPKTPVQGTNKPRRPPKAQEASNKNKPRRPRKAQEASNKNKPGRPRKTQEASDKNKPVASPKATKGQP